MAQLLNLVYIEEMMKVRKNLLTVDYIVKIMLGLLNMAIMKMKHLIISKKKIIQIIQASQDNNLKAIEKIDFGDAIKWKIAFHYQDVKNIKIVNIFSKNVLDLISLNEFKEKLKIYQIHKKLLENKNLSLVKMIENIAIPLWNKYGMNSQNYIDKMKNLFSEYLNKKKLDKNTINKYIQVIENISKEF